MQEYYVYAYLDPRIFGDFKYGEYRFDYEPFYIGKGKGNRCKEHLSQVINESDNSNIRKLKKIQEILKENKKPIIVKFKENLLENDAFKTEIKLIKIIKRFPFGPLMNLTQGGDGIKNIIITEEYKNKFRGKNNGMYKRSVYDAWLEKYGKHEADNRLKKWKESISISGKGRSNIWARKEYIFKNIITGEIVKWNTGYRKWCKKYNISGAIMWRKRCNDWFLVENGEDPVVSVPKPFKERKSLIGIKLSEEHKNKISEANKKLTRENNSRFISTPKELIPKIKQYNKDGLSIRQISKILGYKYGTMNRIFKEVIFA